MNENTIPERKSSGHDSSTAPDHHADPGLVADAIALSAFQRDILSVLARNGETYGLGIKRELEEWYGDVNHGRLYPNLDELEESGYLERSQIDKRTNGYSLTADGRRVFDAYANHVFAAAMELAFETASELRADGAGLDEYESLADAEMDGVYPCRQCGERFGSEEERDDHTCGKPVLADGGVEIESIEDAVEAIPDAVEVIPDADPNRIAQYDDGHGHFIINSNEDDQDVGEIDEALSAAGFERDGALSIPGMLQQNFKSADDDGGAE